MPPRTPRRDAPLRGLRSQWARHWMRGQHTAPTARRLRSRSQGCAFRGRGMGGVPCRLCGRCAVNRFHPVRERFSLSRAAAAAANLKPYTLNLKPGDGRRDVHNVTQERIVSLKKDLVAAVKVPPALSHAAAVLPHCFQRAPPSPARVARCAATRDARRATTPPPSSRASTSNVHTLTYTHTHTHTHKHTHTGKR